MTSVQSAVTGNGAVRRRRTFPLGARWKAVLPVVLAVTGLAMLSALLATPRYEGETRLLVEGSPSTVGGPGSNASSTRPIAERQEITGHVDVILSSDLLEKVARKLDLPARKEFDEMAEPSRLSRLLVAAGLSSDPGEIPPEERVLKAFRDRLSVYPVQGSRVIVIGMSSEDPELAAGIPNALADAYLAMQHTPKARSIPGKAPSSDADAPNASRAEDGLAASGEQGNFLVADARVVSRAIIPSDPYFPRVLLISGGAFGASLLMMLLITLLREWFSGSSMRPAQGARPEPIDEVAVPQWTPFEPEERMRLPPAPVDVPLPFPDAGSAVPASLGEIDIEGAAEKLIASAATRAIFISPEGDDAAAVAVLVARAVAASGLRVLLLDLTASGAASQPTLDSVFYPGITDLLASEAQFTDVIHQDHYSDCHIMPVGTADPIRAMRAADRLPIIMDSLTTAYNLVIVECGPTDAEGMRRLVTGGTEVLLSVMEADSDVAEAAEGLKESGFPGLTLVRTAGYRPPAARLRDRSAA